MQYFFFRMQRIRVIIILGIVALIVAAYWLMTSSPKHVNVHRMKDRVYHGKTPASPTGQKIDVGHFGGRLGRNTFPKSPDGKISKEPQWKETFDIPKKGQKFPGEKGQIGRPFKDPVGPSKDPGGQSDPNKNVLVKLLHPGDKLPKVSDSNLKRSWNKGQNSAEKNPSWKLNPSIDNMGKNKLGRFKDKDKSLFGHTDVMKYNKFPSVSREQDKFGVDAKDKNILGSIRQQKLLDKSKLGGLGSTRGDQYGNVEKKTFGSPDKIKKPGDQMSQNTLNRNMMLDDRMALERKQLREALQKDRTHFQYLDGKVEAYARALGIPDAVFHRNKKYENKPRPNVSPVPHKMGPPEAYIITTDKRPKDKLMPSVGNGHVATVVDSDTVLMNGLYSGIGNASTRARIQAMVTFKITDFHPTGLPHKRNYTMNMLEGIYTETITGDDFIIEKRTYAHRSVPNLLVSELDVFRSYKPGQTILKLIIENVRGSLSKDITMREVKCKFDNECTYIHGEVNAYEKPPTKPEVHIYYDQVPPRLDVPVVPVGQKGMRLRWIFTASIAGSQQEAEASFILADDLISKNELLAQHRSSWMYLWNDGALTMDGNLRLSQAVFSAMYNTLSSLPTVDDPARRFFGLSPTDLAHGHTQVDYSGHIKSDQEIWMFPNILLFHADMAKHLINTRVRNQKMAQQNAKENGFLGAQFPAEMAFSGIEVGPPESKYEIHTGGDISHAIMQYMYMTKDVHFYAETAKQLLIDISNFYQNRIVFNMTRHQYFIKGVLSLDKKHGKVTNSLYTNTVARIALSAPYILSSYFGLKSDHLKNWLAIANKTYIPYDKVTKFHPEFDGYTSGMKVSTPEALMLRYPLMQHVPLESLRKDVSVYEREIDGPDTSWITLALGFMQLHDFESAWSKLKGTMMNVQQPFQVWTETSTGGGARGYLTLMGGFLQAIINGYAGVRILPDRLEFDPTLPPQVRTMNLTSVDYMGSAFDFKINENSIIISMTKTKYSAPQFKVTVYATGTMHFVKMHQPVVIARQRAAIFPVGSPKMGKPVNDVKVERMQPGVNKLPQAQPDRQLGENVLPQVPRPVVPQQGLANQMPPKTKGRISNQIPSLNQQRFDRLSNSQGLQRQAPVGIDDLRPGRGANGARNLPGMKVAPLGKDPAYRIMPLSKSSNQREKMDTELKVNNLDMIQQKKLKLQLDKKFPGDSGMKDRKDRKDIMRRKLPVDNYGQEIDDTNIGKPLSALQYDRNNRKRNRGFDYGRKDEPRKTRRLRRRGERGL